MRAWDTSIFRTTRDIDLLARVSNEVAVLEEVVREACSASELDFLTLLPMAGTRLLAYPPETVVAEKF